MTAVFPFVFALDVERPLLVLPVVNLTVHNAELQGGVI